MPLSEPVAREMLHQRAIEVRGYLRGDGNYDIEATLEDTKSMGFDSPGRGWIASGEPLHQMRVRMTIDDTMTILTCEAVTELGPYPICPGGAASMGLLAGLTIKPGFLKAANQVLGGTTGCTHLRELLQQMATVAFQTMWPARARKAAAGEAVARPADGSARLLNTCFAYASDGAVVRQRWPHLYTGPEGDPGLGPDGQMAPALQMAAERR